MEGLQSPEARIAALEDAIAEERRLRQKLAESVSLILAREQKTLESENALLRQHIERLTAVAANAKAASANAADTKSHLQ